MRENTYMPLPDGQSLTAVIARPEQPMPEGGWPAVVVLHEVVGFAPEMLDVADRFAVRGWVAVAPDLYSHGNRIARLARAIHELATGTPGQINADIDATRAWLGARDDVDGHRLGVIGFSMGGELALAYAATAPAGPRAVSVNYGRVPNDQQALRAACPIVGSYGRRDLATRSHGVRLEQHLSALGIDHDVEIHPGAGHSFMTDGHHPILKLVLFPLRIGHAQPAADNAWERTFAFFDQHIATPTLRHTLRRRTGHDPALADSRK